MKTLQFDMDKKIILSHSSMAGVTRIEIKLRYRQHAGALIEGGKRHLAHLVVEPVIDVETFFMGFQENQFTSTNLYRSGENDYEIALPDWDMTKPPKTRRKQ